MAISAKKWAAEKMDLEPDSPTHDQSVGGFFPVSLNQVSQMLDQGAEATELIAYLVLSRGKGGKQYSTWGANSCSNYTELTYHKATLAIDWLAAKGFISSFQDHQPKGKRPKWFILTGQDEDMVFLSNALIDGVGAGKRKPPMKRVYEVKMGRWGGLGGARLDLLMVMLHLYRHQMIADYGGVNPASGLYRRWESADNDLRERQTPIIGTDLILHEIAGGSDYVYTRFAEKALSYVADDKERSDRFWDAIDSLRTLGWLYETTQIWTSDPSVDPRAEPLYTLYVHDKQARKQDPYISKEINSLAMKAGILDGYSEFYIDDPDGANIVGTGRFRYIAWENSKSCPIGIYRLKFRAHTRDAAKGFSAEEMRAAYWREFIKSAA